MSKNEKETLGATLADMQRMFLNQQIIAVTPDSIYLANNTVTKFSTLNATNTRLVKITQSHKVGKRWFINRVSESVPVVTEDGVHKYQIVLYQGSRALVRIHVEWEPETGQSEDWRGLKVKRFNHGAIVDANGSMVCERHNKSVSAQDLLRLLMGAVFVRYDREYGYVFADGLRMKPFYGGDLSASALEGGLGHVSGLRVPELTSEASRVFNVEDKFVTVFCSGGVLTRLRARPVRVGAYVCWNVPCVFWLPAAGQHTR